MFVGLGQVKGREEATEERGTWSVVFKADGFAVVTSCKDRGASLVPLSSGRRGRPSNGFGESGANP